MGKTSGCLPGGVLPLPSPNPPARSPARTGGPGASPDPPIAHGRFDDLRAKNLREPAVSRASAGHNNHPFPGQSFRHLRAGPPAPLWARTWWVKAPNRKLPYRNTGRTPSGLRYCPASFSPGSQPAEAAVLPLQPARPAGSPSGNRKTGHQRCV